MIAGKIKIEYRTKRRVVIGASFILLLMIYFFKDSFFILRVSTAIALFILFYSIDHFFKIRFKHRHYFFIILIAILSLFLSPLYYLYPNYDKIQHFFQPMLLCSIIFHMTSRLKLDIKWKIIFAFFVSTALLGLFEMGEYLLDYLFDLKLQGVYLRDISGLDKFHLLQTPIDDTMVDLAYGFLGSGTYAFFLWLILKRKQAKKDKIK